MRKLTELSKHFQSSPFHRAILLGVLLVAFGLRTYQLGNLSLWYDEAYSFQLARFSLAEATRWTARDIVPPLYYYCLHFWLQWAGSRAEYVMRLFSVFVDLLALVFGYRVGRRLFGRRAGELTLFILAVTLLYIHHAQDARMYTLLMACNMAAIWALTEILTCSRRRPPFPGWLGRWGWWAGWGAALGGMSYTHTMGLFLTAGQVLTLVFFSWRQRRLKERWRPLLGVGVGLAVIYLPWLWIVWEEYFRNLGYFPGTLPPFTVFNLSLVYFTSGDLFVFPTGGWITLGVLGVWLSGVLRLIRLEPRTGGGWSSAERALYLLLLLFLPLFLIAGVFYRVPKFSVRYTMAVSAPFYLLLGCGLDAWFRGRGWRRGVAVIGVVGMTGIALAGLQALHTEYWLINEDFRGAARFIREKIAADETVLLLSGHFFPVWDYYYDGERALLPDIPILDLNERLNYEVAEPLNRALAGKRGAWVIHWQDDKIDPNGYVARLLGEAGTLEVLPEYFKGVHITHYRWSEPPHFSSQPAIQYPLDGRFGPVELLGYNLEAGGATLFWRSRAALTSDYQVGLRLVDAEGRTLGGNDGRPAHYQYPTTYWRPGEIVFGTLEIPAPPGTPPGPYSLRVSLYDAATRTPLPLLDAGGQPLGVWQTLPITLTRRWGEADLPAGTAAPAEGGLLPALQVVGYTREADTVMNGMPLDLSLYWLARQAPGADYSLRVDWISGGTSVLSATWPLVSGYGTAAWQPGELVRGRYSLRAPLAAGEFSWRLQLLDADGNPAGTSLTLPPVTVQAGEPLLTALPEEPRFPSRAVFEGGLALLGADLSAEAVRAGEPVTLTLYWQAQNPAELDLTVYTHLVDAQGQVITQHDSVPAEGNRPVRTWRPGEIIVDRHVWNLPAALAPGTYPIRVGMYQAAEPGMPRLTVNDPSAGGGPADGVTIGGVTMRP